MRIIEASEHLFRNQGYQDTKIQAIAEQAGVSVGTVYNYFETKSDIVMTLVTRHAEFVDAEIEEIISRASNLPGNDICGFFFAMTTHSLQHLGKENWRILYGLSIAQPKSQLGAKFAHFNGRCRSLAAGLSVHRASRSPFTDIRVVRPVTGIFDLPSRVDKTISLPLFAVDGEIRDLVSPGLQVPARVEHRRMLRAHRDDVPTLRVRGRGRDAE